MKETIIEELNRRGPLPKINSISPEWEERLEKARTYIGGSEYSTTKRGKTILKNRAAADKSNRKRNQNENR